jgi:hypothetical protein
MRALGTALMLVALAAGSAAAQELEPRAYSPSPIGTTFLVVTATRSAGGVFTDPSAPISNVEAEVGLLGLGVGHVFAAAGKQALVLALLPVAWGEASGDVGEERRFASRRGLADPRVKLSMILAGSPAMDRETFARTPRRTVVGTSLTIAMPAGQYDPARLINLGLNRWAFKPEIGISYPARRWTLDAYAGVWFFTENDAYFPGSSIRRQDPVVALQGHVSYTLGRRAWLAVNATWYAGGRTTVDGEDKGDLLRNARLGATWALPIGSRQSFKVSYSAGAATRIGSDFRTIGVAWQILIL